MGYSPGGRQHNGRQKGEELSKKGEELSQKGEDLRAVKDTTAI